MPRKPKIPPMWKHQRQTFNFAKKRDIVYDTSDPGTGKTRAQIEALKHKDGFPALIVAPRSLLEAAWESDIQKFAPELKTSIAWANNREEAFEKKADIYIINTDGVKFIAKKPSRWFKKVLGNYPSLVIDEITDFKNVEGTISQRARAMAKISKKFKYRSGLTGTPNPKSVLDIWGQAFILDQGERLSDSYYAFRNSVCAPDPDSQFNAWIDKPGAEEAVAGMLSDISIRHKFEDCMDIPPLHVYDVEYSCSPKVLKTYRKMADEALIEIEGGTVSAINAASMRTKLLQIASGAVYGQPDDPNSDYILLDTKRYELLLDLVTQTDHSVVFFNWRHQRDELIKEAKRRKIKYALIDGSVSGKDRGTIIKRYQAGHFDTLFMHPATGAHGITVTKGTRTIWCSPVYRPDWFKQGNHRVYRGGQTQKTESLMVQARGTVEHTVYEIMQEKKQRMLNLLDILES